MSLNKTKSISLKCQLEVLWLVIVLFQSKDACSSFFEKVFFVVLAVLLDKHLDFLSLLKRGLHLG